MAFSPGAAHANTSQCRSVSIPGWVGAARASSGGSERLRTPDANQERSRLHFLSHGENGKFKEDGGSDLEEKEEKEVKVEEDGRRWTSVFD